MSDNSYCNGCGNVLKNPPVIEGVVPNDKHIYTCECGYRGESMYVPMLEEIRMEKFFKSQRDRDPGGHDTGW